MQPGLGLAKNKPNWKETNKKSQQKGGWKVIQLVLIKGIEWLDQLSAKRKGNLQVSLALKKVQKRTWQLIQYFWLLRPNYQLEHWITRREKKWIQNLLCIGSNSLWFKLVFLLPGNDKDHENEFLHNKNIIWHQYHFANSTEVFRFRNENYA